MEDVPPSSTSRGLASEEQEGQQRRRSIIYGIKAGLGGALVMALISAVVLGVSLFFVTEGGPIVTEVIVFLIIGVLISLWVGPTSGGALGFILNATGKEGWAPYLGAAMPALTIFPPVLLFVAFADSSEKGLVFLLAMIAVIIYTPIGQRAGRWYVRKVIG